MDEQRTAAPSSAGPTTEVQLGDESPGELDRGGIRGTVRIAPAVLIELIELTVRAVPGVTGFQARRRVERILPRGGHGTATSKGTSASAFEGGGIRVRIDGDRIDADVSIVIACDLNILDLSRTIQRQVGIAVGRMLGMTVNEVNVYVASVSPAKDAEG